MIFIFSFSCYHGDASITLMIKKGKKQPAPEKQKGLEYMKR